MEYIIKKREYKKIILRFLFKKNLKKSRVVIFCVSLVLTLYFLFIGYLVDDESLLYGYSLMILLIMLILELLIKLIIGLKYLLNKKMFINNKIEYCITKNQECYSIVNKNTNVKKDFTKEQIEILYSDRKYLIIKIDNLLFPVKKEDYIKIFII